MQYPERKGAAGHPFSTATNAVAQDHSDQKRLNVRNVLMYRIFLETIFSRINMLIIQGSPQGGPAVSAVFIDDQRIRD